MSTRVNKSTGQNSNRSPKRTPRHFKRPMHLRDEGERALASRGIRPWHVALSVVLTASLVVAGLHTDAIADVLGLSATAEPEQVTETTQPAANDAATADATGAAASGARPRRPAAPPPRRPRARRTRPPRGRPRRSAPQGPKTARGGVPHRTV